MLHYRPNGGSNYTGNKLFKLFKQNIKIECPDLKNNSDKVYRLIVNQAKIIASCSDNSQKIEEKIVLSIALRIYGEKYMRHYLKRQMSRLPSDFNFDFATFGKMIEQFKRIYSNKTEAINVLEIIGIFTPMEIHINGFAYEPLIDYSITRMRTLFTQLLCIMPSSIK